MTTRLKAFVKRSLVAPRQRPTARRMFGWVARNHYRYGRSDSLANVAMRRIKHYGIFVGDDRRASVERLVELFFDIADVVSADLFIEAGAKEATASQRAADDHGCRAIAFEANPYTHKRFRAQLAPTPVTYEHLALSDAAGLVDFMVRKSESGQPMADGQGSLLVRPDHEPGYEVATVEAVTLDGYLAAPDLRDHQHVVMWVDVEGALAAVLGGARETLKRVDVMLVEVESVPVWDGQGFLHRDVNDFLAPFGLVPVACDIQSRNQCNVLYVREPLLRRDEISALLTTMRRGQA